MMFHTRLVFAAAILLAGCGIAPPSSPQIPDSLPDDDLGSLPSEGEQIDAPAPVRETRNVTYEGIVRPAGISIYQEGSHRLQLDDGRFLLLESDTADLNGYVGERVEVFGALRPTVEDGGMIIRVEAISLIIDETEPADVPAEVTEVPTTSSAEESDPAPAPQEETPSPAESTIATEETPPAEEEQAESDEEETPEPATQTAPPPSPALAARIEAMASESFDAGEWTQQYCTAHIGFCIPVHRNWWFKSFGATTSMLWHVEMSSEEIANLFDGPIHINLVSGTVGAKKAADGQIREEPDGTVVGYRSWTDNRHFEISAAPALSEAVRYITQHLEEYTGE